MLTDNPPDGSKVPVPRAATETALQDMTRTVGIDSPRSILNAAPSDGIHLCVSSDGGGLRENQTQSEHGRAFAGSTASARRRLRDRLPVDSAEGFSKIDGARKNSAKTVGVLLEALEPPLGRAAELHVVVGDHANK